jgi:hypothetical protein
MVVNNINNAINHIVTPKAPISRGDVDTNKNPVTEAEIINANITIDM